MLKVSLLSLLLAVSALAHATDQDDPDRQACLSQLKERIRNHQVGLAGLDSVVAGLEKGRRFVAGEALFSLKVHEGADYAYGLKYEQDAFDGDAEHDLEISIDQERTSDFFFGLTVNSRYGLTKTTYVDIEQKFDVDRSCRAVPFSSEILNMELKNGKAFWKTETTDYGASAKPKITTFSAAVPQGLPVHLWFPNPPPHASLARMLEMYPEGGQFMIVSSSPEVPFIQATLNWSLTNDADRLLNQTVKFDELTMTLDSQEFTFQIHLGKSTQSEFTITRSTGEETWGVDEPRWMDTDIQQLQHSDLDKIKLFADGTLPKEIQITSSTFEFPNLEAYWSTEGAASTDGQQSVILAAKPPVHMLGKGRSTYLRHSDGQFLVESEYVQYNIPEIRGMAREALKFAGDYPSTRALVAAIGKTLNEHFYYDHRRLDAGGRIEDLPATELVKLGSGTCQNFSVLFASIARSLGLPTRIVVGYYLDDSGEALHAWNEFLDENGNWQPYDSENVFQIFDSSQYVPIAIEQTDTQFETSVQSALGYEFHFKVLSTRLAGVSSSKS